MKVQYLSDLPIPWQDFYAMTVKIDLGLKKLLAVLKKEDLSMKFENKRYQHLGKPWIQNMKRGKLSGINLPYLFLRLVALSGIIISCNKKSATYLLRETAVTGRVSVAVSEFIIFYHYKIVNSTKFK